MAVLDHIVFAVEELEAGCRWFADHTGVVPEIGGVHPGRGTHNALVSLGDSYIELIAPDPNQPAPDGPRPFGVDDLAGDGLVAFAVRPSAGESIEDLVQRCSAAGHNTGPVLAMSRQRPDGAELRWRLTLPSGDGDGEGAIPFLIDWGSSDQPSETAPGGLHLIEIIVTHPDPHATGRTHRALGLDVIVNPSDRPGLRATVRGPGGDVVLRPASR